jgi:hypothetical protein
MSSRNEAPARATASATEQWLLSVGFVMKHI